MSQKLTNELKKAIIENVVRAAVAARRKTLNAKLAVAAQKLFDLEVPPDMYVAMKALPSGFFATRDEVRVVVPDADNGFASGRRWQFDSARLMPAHMVYLDFWVKDDHPHYKEVLALAQEENALKKVADDLKIEVKKVVEGCSTVAKLQAAWGEDIDAHIPVWALEPKKALPAVPTDKVKEMIVELKAA